MSFKRIVSLSVFLAVFLFAGLGEAQISTTGRKVSSANSVGKVTDVRGKAEIRRFGQVGGVQVEELMPIHENDVIETGERSRLKVLFSDDSIVRVGEDTKLKISKYMFNKKKKERKSIFNLFKGRVRALVSKFMASSASKYEIHTPTAVAGVRGTDIGVEVTPKGVSFCYLFTGSANWGNDQGSVLLKSGFFSSALAGQGVTDPAAFSADLRNKRNAAMRVRSSNNSSQLGSSPPPQTTRDALMAKLGINRRGFFTGGQGPGMFNSNGLGVPDQDTYLRPGTIRVNTRFGE